MYQIDISQTHIRNIALESVVPIVPSVTFVTLVRCQLLDEISRAATIGNTTHATTGVERAIFIFLLLCRQGVGAEHIVETVENDIMIETWVTVLEWMSRVKTRLRIIKGTSVCHTVGIVHVVGRRHVDNLVMLNE